MNMKTKSSIGRTTTVCMSLAGRPGTFGSRFHNRLYEEMDMDYIYKAFTTDDLPAAISGIRALGVRGCAISMPFKEAVIPLLDKMDSSASVIESVNTIVNTHGELVGYNTDYSAVRELIEKSSAETSSPFLLRGSGGMAKAVAAAFKDAGFNNGTIIARNERAGQALSEQYGLKWMADVPARAVPILVNATPIGMAGENEHDLAFPEEMIASCSLAFDVVALPLETPFLKSARAHNKITIDGGQVAVLQALAQFKLYTGIEPGAEQLNRAIAYARG